MISLKSFNEMVVLNFSLLNVRVDVEESVFFVRDERLVFFKLYFSGSRTLSSLSDSVVVSGFFVGLLLEDLLFLVLAFGGF